MSLDLVTKPGIQLMFLLVEMCKSRNTHTHDTAQSNMLHSWDTARTYQKPSLYARAVQREFPQNGETEVVTCSTQESFLPY